VIAERLRRFQKKVILLVNKADRESAAIVCSEFYAMGFSGPHAVSAKSGRGIEAVVLEALNGLPKSEAQAPDIENSIRIAVVGRPNVGKSTLINRMLGEDRLVVLDQPGTTRDSIYVPFVHRDQKYTLIDTAGVRRRRKITDTVEKFSMIKTLQAMKAAHVVIILVDAQDSLGEQDMRLLGMVVDMGKALVLVFNKWDGMDEYAKSQFKDAVDRKLLFVDYARRYFISALHGTGVGNLYRAINEAYTSTMKEISTSQLTKALEKAVHSHQPPLVKGRRVKMRYAHIGSQDPLLIVVHGKQTAALPGSYQRYLSNFFRKTFNLLGIPVLVKLKSDENPYDS
jgi:GTPase